MSEVSHTALTTEPSVSLSLRASVRSLCNRSGLQKLANRPLCTRPDAGMTVATVTEMQPCVEDLLQPWCF